MLNNKHSGDMNCIIAHPNISPYIKQSVIAYQEHDILDKFYTTYFQHPQYPFSERLIRFFPQFEKEFRRRSIAEIDYPYLRGRPYQEMLRVFTARYLKQKLMNRVWQWSELSFDKWVAGQLKAGTDWVHAYEHAALATIQRAKELKIPTFYEQSSQHHAFLSTILKDQLEQYPDLECETTQILLNRRTVRANARRDQELEECDHIICNSTFTVNTLKSAGIPEQKIICIPYGFPQVSNEPRERLQDGKTIFLFAGNSSLRKGVHILFEAWKKCNFDPAKTELRIIGKTTLSAGISKGLPSSVCFINNLPHPELMDHFRQANVMVLPTLADGFGMVISEAMAIGLPVLTTLNSGGPDIIDHGKNGMLVEAGNVDALCGQMNWCYTHTQELDEMGGKAQETARRYPWTMFRQRLLDEVLSRVQGKDHHN